MSDSQETGGPLVEELAGLRARSAKLEQVEAELKLTQESLRFQAMLLDHIGDQITATDLQGRIKYVNRAEAEGLGWSGVDLLGRSVETYGQDPARGPRQREIIAKTLEDGQWQGEVVNHRRDGSEVILHCRTWVMRDESGNPRGLCGVSTDITERKRAVAALEASEANYRAIFNAANDAIFVHDLHTGDILDVNEKMCEMYGYAPEEARQLNVAALSSDEPPYTQENALRWIQKAVQGQPQVFEWLAKDKAGRRFWVEVNLKRAAIGGQDRLLAIVRDITERKRSEAERHKMEARLQ